MRRKKEKEIPAPSRFDRWTDNDLINCIEAEMARTGELFRGLSQPELDNEWVLQEMEIHTDTALQAIRALRRRVANLQSL
jgi:hypothetical protein